MFLIIRTGRWAERLQNKEQIFLDKGNIAPDEVQR